MKLKAPVVAVGATLAGGVAQAQQPVTITPIVDGYEIVFASGTQIKVGEYEITTTLGSMQMAKKADGKKEPPASKLTADGLELEASGLWGNDNSHFDLLGGSDGVEISVAPNGFVIKQGVVIHIADDGPDDELGSITIEDVASGGIVTIDPLGFHVWAEGLKPIFTEVPGIGYDPDGNWRLGVPEHVVAVFPYGVGGGGTLSVKGVSLDTLTLTGQSTATRFEDLRAKDVFVAGDHAGVLIDASLIQTLTAEGTLTGAAVQGSMIGQYFGPDTFQVSDVITKF